MLRQFQSIATGRVNAESGTIFGVSVITIGEALGHDIWIDATTLSQVKKAADAFDGGVKVKMDHYSGVGAIVGVLKNFTISGNQLRADLSLLKEHEARPKIIEMASTIPESFGLSIAFSGKPELVDKVNYARCEELYSVDLVDAPAANPSGLFSAHVDSTQFTKTMIDDLKNLLAKLGEKIDGLRSQPADAVAAFKTQLTEFGTRISGELTQALSDLTTAKQTISSLNNEKTDLTSKLEKAQGEVNALGTQMKAANDKVDASIATLKQTVKADASLSDKITALEGAVTNTLASMGIDPKDIPTGGAGEGAGSKVSADAIVKQFQAETDPRKKAAFYQKHKAAIQAARSTPK